MRVYQVDMDISNEKILSEIAERLLKIMARESPNYGTVSEIARKIGINRATLQAMAERRNRPNAETITAFCRTWSKYALWIMTGNTIPEHGQTSPDLELLAEAQRRVNEAANTQHTTHAEEVKQ